MISIDNLKCTACGICGTVCPRHILETFEEEDEKHTRISREREGLCMVCGHCTAVCPSGAIRVEGLDFDAFKPVRPLDITEESLLALMEQRRSVRRYKDEPVPRETLNRIIESAHRAPTGTGRQSTGVLVVDKPETLQNLSKLLHELYQGLDKALGNPIARLVIKRRVGNNIFRTLQDFVMPGMRWYLKWKKEGRGDEILRDCKALILFHSPILEPMGEKNCVISAFHAIFMAEVLGVGTCFNDLVPPACNRSPEIRKFLGLPKDREVYSSLTLGFAKFKYRKIIPRRLAEVRYLN
jgi:nitroreductase/NAD-dependent dihydropyrimidine dehydrogenase PreA subunit